MKPSAHLEHDPQGGAQHLLKLLETFFLPFLIQLDEVLDKRLVRTLLQCLVAIIRCRNNPQVLWLSELGSSLSSYDGDACSAAAGAKRVGKLLRSVKWAVERIDRYLLEKAESEKAEGLCPVLSVPRQAEKPHETGSGLQLARSSPRAGDGDAMDSGADRGDGRASPPGRDKVVDDERGLCHQATRCRRRGITHLYQEMEIVAGSYL